MFKRVLVPLDGSMLAESALEPALHLAQQANGIVYLIRVPIYMDSGEQTSLDYNQVWVANPDVHEHEDVSNYLHETRESIMRTGVSVRIIVGEGDPANSTLNTAVARDVDLIVMASHARRGISRWLLGSVSGKIIREARTPVMLIRQPSDFRHILITLDGSELSEHVIDPALGLASCFGSQVTFLQVRDATEEDSTVTLTNNEALRRRTSYLDEILLKYARYAPENLEMDRIVMRGAVVENIVSFALEHDIDLIAMSTNGRSGLRKLMFGSVTEKVMCDSGCTMLITRPTDQELS